jgi:hypothetical protein
MPARVPRFPLSPSFLSGEEIPHYKQSSQAAKLLAAAIPSIFGHSGGLGQQASFTVFVSKRARNWPPSQHGGLKSRSARRKAMGGHSGCFFVRVSLSNFGIFFHRG